MGISQTSAWAPRSSRRIQQHRGICRVQVSAAAQPRGICRVRMSAAAQLRWVCRVQMGAAAQPVRGVPGTNAGCK
eukprot:gene9565-biopygen9208